MSDERASDGRAKYIMLGGFLGAGKTTAVAQLGTYLTERGHRVGLITNDQSTGLVDTKVLRGRGFAVEEIAGGCFCCRFDSLHDAATKLTTESRPDVIIAEPVGSCTDLVATVSYPLRRIYGDAFTIAPLSVLVDPIRAARIFGLEAGRSFSSKVVYVYRKQLEEANVIVINKCDLISEQQRADLEAALREAFPRAEVLSCAAKAGRGLTGWFDRVMEAACEEGATMQVDYERYAEGEALLGWLNMTIGLMADEPFDGNALLMDLTDRIGRRLKEEGAEIAHLKMTLEANDAGGSLSVVSLVSSDGEPDLRESLLDRTNEGTLIVNLRAEADPNLLEEVARVALAACAAANGNVVTKVEHSEHFRPGKPEPTHRVEVSA